MRHVIMVTNPGDVLADEVFQCQRRSPNDGGAAHLQMWQTRNWFLCCQIFHSFQPWFTIHQPTKASTRVTLPNRCLQKLEDRSEGCTKCLQHRITCLQCSQLMLCDVTHQFTKVDWVYKPQFSCPKLANDLIPVFWIHFTVLMKLLWVQQRAEISLPTHQP